MNITGFLNNREIATGIWLLIFCFWALSIAQVRSSIFSVLKVFFTTKLFLPFLFMVFYIVGITMALARVGFWDTSAIKDTVIWFFGGATVLYFSLNEAANDEKFFRRTFIGVISLIAIFEFIVNLYPFHIAVELILVPVVSFLVIMSTVAKLKPEHMQVKKALDFLLTLIGIVIIVFIIRAILGDLQNFATLKNLRDFMLPIIFTLGLLPLIYAMALVIQYESVFLRIDFLNKNSPLTKAMKWKLFKLCTFNLPKLNTYSKKGILFKVNSKEDINNFEERFINN